MLILAVLGLAGAVYHYTRPATLARLILPRASDAIGGDVRASRIAFGGLSTIVLSDLSIRVPGWEGLAGEVLVSNRIEVNFSIPRLLFGDFFLRSVHVDELRLRLAESNDKLGQFSILALDPKPTDPEGGAPQRPALITVNDLVIENGVATADGYTELGQLRFTGGIQPSSESPTAFRLQLKGRPDDRGELLIAKIEGSFDPQTEAISVTCDDLEIDSRKLAVAPLSVRRWMEHFDVSGRVTRARFDTSPSGEPFALIDLRGAAVNLPVDSLSGGALANAWGGFARGKAVDLVTTPRMKLETGSLRLERNELHFEDVSGQLGAWKDDPRVIALPFKGDFKVRLPVESLPPFEWKQRDTWIENAARIAPFEISLEIPSFESPEPAEGAPDTLQLPRAAARLLEDFNITSWKIRVNTSIRRDPPSPEGVPGVVHSDGELVLERGSGAFEEFPYRLEQVSGRITFTDDNVLVERIEGVGAEGAKVAISGRLDGVSQGALIDLRIDCEDAPIDSQLFGAFEQAPREALQLLFDERAARQLGEAALLPDENLLVAQRAELTRLGDGPEHAERRARLERSRDAGAFRLGGRCGFEIRVFSEPGWGKPVEVTGHVDVRNAGLVFTRFPYPLRLEKGSFLVLDEAIEIVGDGITAVTPAGGLLTVSGKVEIPRLPDKSRGLRIDMRIKDSADALNPTLLAAIPHSVREVPMGWPGANLAPAGRLLSALGLSGDVALDGTVATDASGEERFDFRIDFRNGTAAPDEKGRAQLAEDGLPWPPEFVLTDCAASIELTPERAIVRDCTGRNGDGSISASTSAELEGPNRLIDLTLADIPIGRAFESYLAADPAEATKRFNRFQPSGAISGKIRRVVDEEGARTSGELTPSALEVTLDGTRARFERVSGAIAVGADGLRARDLEFRIVEGDQPGGSLRLGGPLSESEGGSEEKLTAVLTDCRIESALVREILTQRAKGVLDLLKSRNARGRFDATFESTTAEGRSSEHFSILPHELTLGQADSAIELAFQDGDHIRGDGADVAFELHGAIRGKHTGSLEAKGNYEARADNRLFASMRLLADGLSPALRDQLPPPLDMVARQRDVLASRRFELVIDDLGLRWPQNGNAAEPDLYTLRGLVRLEGGSFSAGTRFSEIDGDLPLRLRYEPRGATPIDFQATLNAKGGRVFDRSIGATTATLATRDGGRGFIVDGAGDVAFGRFDLNADLDFDKDSYRARVRVAETDYDALRTDAKPGEQATRNPSRLSGLVNLAGSLSGSAETRTGDGRVTIRNATLASMPVAMRVLQLTQLMLPMSSTISATDAEFTIRGNTADVSRVTMNAGTIDLEGKGTVDLPTFAVGLRLFAKGTIPIVSDVIGGVTSQIFAVDVSGTLAEPKASIAALPGISAAPEAPVSPVEPVSPPSDPPSQPKEGGDSGANPAQEPKKPQR